MSTRKNAHPERSRTNASLTAERAKTDTKLDELHRSAGRETTEALQLARARADRILAAARLEADAESHRRQTTTDQRRAVDAERVLGDRLRERERALQDERLPLQRDSRNRLIKEILRAEREQTNEDLREERERADQLAGTQDDFFAMVSHDVRNIISTVSVILALIVRDTSNSRQAIAQADRALRSLGRMLHLLTDLTDVASIKAGRVAIRPAETDIAAVADEVVEDYRAPARQKGVSLRWETPRPIPAVADADRIAQVLGNLLNNAVKFTPTGGHITVSAAPHAGEIHVSVADNGPGITADKLTTIFDAFRQADRADRRGFGLGLYIARKVIEAHGGRLWVESTPGEGSTFHFTLPSAGILPAS